MIYSTKYIFYSVPKEIIYLSQVLSFVLFFIVSVVRNCVIKALQWDHVFSCFLYYVIETNELKTSIQLMTTLIAYDIFTTHTFFQYDDF